MDNEKIAQELVKIAKELSAASEIEISELPDEQQKLIKDLGVKADGAWDGLHGYIIMFGKERLDKNDIKKLSRNKIFRWIESNSYGGLTIGC